MNADSINASNTNHAEGNVDLLVYNKFFADSGPGIFIDIGAARPDFLSVSSLYRFHGWRVLALEPNPLYEEYYKKLGLERLPYACGDHDADDVDFTVVNSHGVQYEGGSVTFESFSSLSIKDEYASLKQGLNTSVIKVKLRTLNTILRTHAPDVEFVDVISVDVEGWEVEALKGLDFSKFQPKVLVIENLFFDPGYRRYMQTLGYTLWKRRIPNEVYVKSELLRPIERSFSMLDTRCRVIFHKLIGFRRSLMARLSK